MNGPRKTAIVTGASQGIGAGIAKGFVERGFNVVANAQQMTQSTEVAASNHVALVDGHIGKPATAAKIVETALARFKSIDVLVNNAGIFKVVPMLQTSLDLYRQVTEINQTGTFLGMKAVAPVMIEQGTGGSIVNISSVAGLMGSSTAFAYGASKWAVRGMTKGAALELAPHRIRVNSIHPGLVTTPMLDEFDKVGGRDAIRRAVPIGEESEPVEIAKLALFLASDDSRHSTGSEFVVDGGMTA